MDALNQKTLQSAMGVEKKKSSPFKWGIQETLNENCDMLNRILK